MKEPDVSVIIGTYNRCDVLRGALECLLSQDSGGAEFEVIVVDNNSTDDTRNMVENLRFTASNARKASRTRVTEESLRLADA
jgi:glycosyltransferase involved in cell wall biosynthesis